MMATRLARQLAKRYRAREWLRHLDAIRRSPLVTIPAEGAWPETNASAR